MPHPSKLLKLFGLTHGWDMPCPVRAKSRWVHVGLGHVGLGFFLEQMSHRTHWLWDTLGWFLRRAPCSSFRHSHTGAGYGETCLQLKRKQNRFAATVLGIGHHVNGTLRIILGRRKFRSQTSDKTDTWKSRDGKSQRGEVTKREGQRRERVRKQKTHVHSRRKKVASHGVCPMICGSRGLKRWFAKAAGAEPSGQMRH